MSKRTAMYNRSAVIATLLVFSVVSAIYGHWAIAGTLAICYLSMLLYARKKQNDESA